MKIKELRKKAGLSQTALAERLGVKQNTISDWESEKFEPGVEKLAKLAEIFGVSIDELCGRKTLPTIIFSEKAPKLFHDGYIYGQYQLTATVEEIEDAIYDDLNDIKNSFFQIGYKLDIIQRNRIFNRLGYETIVDYAEAKFGFGKTTTYDMLNVYNSCYDAKNPLAMKSEYKKYNYSQLVAMCGSNYASGQLPFYIEKDDSVADIKKFVRVWNKAYSQTDNCPEGKNLKEVLAIAESKKETPSTIPPGQTELELTEDDYEYVQYSDESINTSSLLDSAKQDVLQNDVHGVPAWRESMKEHAQEARRISAAELFKEEPKNRHVFKNTREREEFIRDGANYKIEVFYNSEIDLRVERLDFANGACVYRSTWHEWIEWKNEFVAYTKYHLVDKNCTRRPPESACCTNYALKSYTLDGTAVGYIVNYMTMYKDEI